jgi:hypothetical protein
MKMPESKQQSTRQGGGALPDLVKARLLIDIVANPLYSCEDILGKLPDRQYKDYSLQSIRNRFHYLVRLKKKDPANFWLLFSNANKSAPLSGPYRDQVEEESDDEEPPSTPPAQSRKTPNTIFSTPPCPPSSNSKNMKNSRAKVMSPSPATSAYAYNTMFSTMDEAEATGMFPSILD